MLVSNLLILSAGVATVSARSIGSYISHINSPFTPTTTPHIDSLDCASPPPATDTTSSPTSPRCVFAPHQPLQKTQNPATIPLHAWPHIHRLLASALHPSSSSSASTQSSLQTLHLAEQTRDSSLESVVLGIVYTAPASPSPSSPHPELRSLHARGASASAGVGGDQRSEQEECMEAAVRDVVVERRMEGVFELEGGRGKVGFLVYRID